VPNHLKRDPAPLIINTGVRFNEVDELLKRGYIVAQVGWREPPDFKLPIGVQDVKCGVRYLRANAAMFHIDPKLFGAWGCSRGGYMAAIVGVTDAGAGMEGNSGFPDTSSRLQAVAMVDGIANFRTDYANARGELSSVHGIKSLDDPLVARLSPTTYITNDDPPFLIIATDSEGGGWIRQAQEMDAALRAVSIPSQVVLVKNADHCFETARSGTQPSEEEIARMMGDFFDQTLK
jgi:acetyl esterase/lipase